MFTFLFSAKGLKFLQMYLSGKIKHKTILSRYFYRKAIQSMLEQINISELVNILASLIGFQFFVMFNLEFKACQNHRRATLENRTGTPPLEKLSKTT